MTSACAFGARLIVEPAMTIREPGASVSPCMIYSHLEFAVMTCEPIVRVGACATGPDTVGWTKKDEESTTRYVAEDSEGDGLVQRSVWARMKKSDSGGRQRIAAERRMQGRHPQKES